MSQERSCYRIFTGTVERVCENILAWEVSAQNSDFVTPAQAGVQEPLDTSWIPACAGMTTRFSPPMADYEA